MSSNRLFAIMQYTTEFRQLTYDNNRTPGAVDQHRLRGTRHQHEKPLLIDPKLAPYAALILRVGLGVMFGGHGLILKYFVFTLA